jgi:hypothetical protein
VVVAIKKDAYAILLFSTIMLFYWYYGKKWIAKRRAKKSFEKSEFKNKRIEISIDKDGFTLLQPSQEKWSWNEIQKVIILGDDIMLYRHLHFHYIPNNGFKSLEEKSRFKSLVKQSTLLI